VTVSVESERLGSRRQERAYTAVLMCEASHHTHSYATVSPDPFECGHTGGGPVRGRTITSDPGPDSGPSKCRRTVIHIATAIRTMLQRLCSPHPGSPSPRSAKVGRPCRHIDI
jgi:hypothetical protein